MEQESCCRPGRQTEGGGATRRRGGGSFSLVFFLEETPSNASGHRNHNGQRGKRSKKSFFRTRRSVDTHTFRFSELLAFLFFVVCFLSLVGPCLSVCLLFFLLASLGAGPCCRSSFVCLSGGSLISLVSFGPFPLVVCIQMGTRFCLFALLGSCPFLSLASY